MLIKAVISSRAKGYHGKELNKQEDFDTQEQALARSLNLLDPIASVEMEKTKVENKQINSVNQEKEKFKTKIKAIKPKETLTDADWKELCCKIYDKVYNTINFGKNRDADAAWFAKQHDTEMVENPLMTK